MTKEQELFMEWTMLETMDEFLKRISLEQQEAAEYDARQAKERKIYCGPPQNLTTDYILNQMKGH